MKKGREWPDKCDRCGVKLGVSTMSRQNTDVICLPCNAKENEEKIPTLEVIQEMLKDRKFGDAVATMVKISQHTSYVEIKQLLKDHMPVEGKVAHCLKEDQNIIFWVGSKEMVDLMIELLKQERVFAHSCKSLTYLIDGTILDFPLAQQPPKEGYKEPHWLPITFCTYPPKC